MFVGIAVLRRVVFGFGVCDCAFCVSFVGVCFWLLFAVFVVLVAVVGWVVWLLWLITLFWLFVYRFGLVLLFCGLVGCLTVWFVN